MIWISLQQLLYASLIIKQPMANATLFLIIKTISRQRHAHRGQDPTTLTQRHREANNAFTRLLKLREDARCTLLGNLCSQLFDA